MSISKGNDDAGFARLDEVDRTQCPVFEVNPHVGGNGKVKHCEQGCHGTAPHTQPGMCLSDVVEQSRADEISACRNGILHRSRGTDRMRLIHRRQKCEQVCHGTMKH